MTILDSITRITKTLVIPTTLAITGCGEPPEGTSELNDEQYDKVEYLVEIAGEATPIVKEIVHSMNGGWVDAYGPVDNPEEMIDAIDEVQDTLDYYWASGAFYAGPTSTMIGHPKAIGQHSLSDLTPTDRSDNFIVLNSDREEAWNCDVVVHESTHCLMYHDGTIETELLAVTDVSYTNPEIPKIIHKHNDLAYMNSGLYIGPSNLLVSLDSYRRDTLAEAHARIDAGETREALQQLKNDLEMGDKDEWILDKAQWITDWTVFYAEFGITTEILAEDLAEAGLYETEMEKRTEVIDELTKEISEHHREAAKEIQLPPIEWKVT